MHISDSILQHPAPGSRLIKFRGDTLTFTLSLKRSGNGSAWLRTNIGHAGMIRDEIIQEVHRQISPLGRGWFDIPMKQTGDGGFHVTLPLCDVGHFEAKSFFLKKGGISPVWPDGTNTVINVEPAESCCANIIYNAFVRQFGPNKHNREIDLSREKHIKELDDAGYSVIPPSGTFRELIAQLDFIFGALGCNILQLLPIHPTPTTYARMGRFGSPYAALGFTAVDPSLAVFDPAATPMEQFVELVDAVHERAAKIFLDIAINHTGWAARLHEVHPEWLMRDTQGRIEMPGAWGVVWADLTRLDYSHQDLWRFIADIFLTWCGRGVDGFRCDAGYMIPLSAWKYIVARVRDQFPDTIFLLEGLGGPVAVTRDLLNTANLNWAYSELFQNYDRYQIETYLPRSTRISTTHGLMVHYAETHDNQRLAARSKIYAKMRTALCALFSSNGLFGFANGLEWYATEKIDVHDAPSLNWGASENQVEHIHGLSMILKNHPAFFHGTELRFIQSGPGNYLALLRWHPPTDKRLLVIINLDYENPATGSWSTRWFFNKDGFVVDLLTGIFPEVQTSGEESSILLDPGHVLCLTNNPDDLDRVWRKQGNQFPRSIKQRLKAKVLDVYRHYNGTQDLNGFSPDCQANALFEDPVEFCRHMNIHGEEPRVITWQWPRDERREVMIPPGHFLMVLANTPFRARIESRNRILAQEDSLNMLDGSYFSLFSPLKTPKSLHQCRLKIRVYIPGDCKHGDGPLLFLSAPKQIAVKKYFSRAALKKNPRLFLGTNMRGGMLRAPVFWGELGSRYDALLAANLNPVYPEDRWIMFSRCRAWIVYQGYSQEINKDCLVSFDFDPNIGGCWRFRIPTGQGERMILTVAMGMVPHQNAMVIMFYRNPAHGKQGRLVDSESVRLILRPDIENRNFHAVTKAFTIPEHNWEGAVIPHSRGFLFAPDAIREMQVCVKEGNYTHEPKWDYMVHRPLEVDRGFDPDSDLFSPGYFTTELMGGTRETLTAEIKESKEIPKNFVHRLYGMVAASNRDDINDQSFDQVLVFALGQFIVKRGNHKSIVAGYPWFLDWGRDSLIAVRGLIAVGKTEDARAILHQFGRFEKNGTLPNMIQGDQAGNRETSDASLWFFTACAEFVRTEGNQTFLEELCGERTIREILLSMGNALASTLPNGVKMDPASGLLFSPVHFSWMDTNHPAGTPREGYPIEIQALWYAALSFLSEIDPSGTANGWEKIANKVKQSILQYFYLEEEGYLSDCLHAEPGVSAQEAEPDDALRPNQLFAVVMGAVTDTMVSRKIVTACQELIIPGAIRSLADQSVRHPIPVVHQSRTINDPFNPYQGRYVGNEDTQRKPAYHNGTAWTWVFPSFCQAWVKVYGESARETAGAWLCSAVRLINRNCVGHIPEILDGDFPHTQRGCDAQAWGLSELLRVWVALGLWKK